MNNEVSRRSGAWLVVALLWVVACLNYLDRMLITTMRGSLIEAVPMSETQFGLLISVFLWVYSLLSPLAGFMADRFSRSRVVIFSLFIWSAVTWLTAHAQTYEQLLAARALMGVSEACYVPAALALITDYHRGATRSLATGIHMTGVFVGSGLSGVGGWIAEHYGWTAPFSCFGVFGIAYATLLCFSLKDTARESRHAIDAIGAAPQVGFGEAIASLCSQRAFFVVLASWSLLGVVSWAIGGWMPTYLNEHFGLTQGAAGLSATAYLQTAALVGVLVGGAWADRWSRGDVRGPILVSAIGLCFALPAVLLSATTSVLPLAILGLTVYGFGRAFSDANMMPILCLVSNPRYRATGYGILNLTSGLVGGLSIYAGGMLRDRDVSLSVLFQLAGLSLFVCAALLLLVKPAQNTLRA